MKHPQDEKEATNGLSLSTVGLGEFRAGKNALWLLGNIISVCAGIGIAQGHGVAIGFAVGYALTVLVDIREQTSPNAKLTGPL